MSEIRHCFLGPNLVRGSTTDDSRVWYKGKTKLTPKLRTDSGTFWNTVTFNVDFSFDRNL